MEKIKTSQTNPLPLKPAINAAIQLWSEQGKWHKISVVGNSMLPLMRDGNHVLVAHDSTSIHIGDVIVFWQSDHLFVHRVIRIERTSQPVRFLTKGDNAPNFDSPVSVEEVIGRVIAIQRDDREILLDTKAWRASGYLIAWTTLLLSMFLAIGQRLKQRCVGPQPSRSTAWMRQTLAKIPSRILQFWFALFCRWKR